MILKRLALISSALLLSLAPAAADFSNAGIVSLGDFQIGAAGQQTTPANLQQGQAGGPPALSGLTAMSCQARFFYGAGGTKVNVYLRTSLDQGASFFDVANIAFTTASAIEVINLSGLNAVATPQAPSSLGLGDNTTFNGPLGDRLQAVVISQGTYTANTIVSIRCALR